MVPRQVASANILVFIEREFGAEEAATDVVVEDGKTNVLQSRG